MSSLPTNTKRPVPGITGTSAAFIDVSFILIMVLLFVVAVLKTHMPERVTVDMDIAEQEGRAEGEPMTSIKIFSEGVVVGDGELVTLDRLGAVLGQIETNDGAIGLCVSDGVDYHEVRNTIAIVQNILGSRQWTDCGGRL